jgi:ribonucleoside-diphosphate reductase alpha chain
MKKPKKAKATKVVVSKSKSSASSLKISQIKKRTGELEAFQPDKIRNAILKAFEAVAEPDGLKSKQVADEVVKILEKKFIGKTPAVEHIQDLVEETLMKKGFSKVAKAYILYRQKRAETRAAQALLGIRDELKLGLNALTVLHRRYLLRNEAGKVIETPVQLFRRVAHALADVDKNYGATMAGAKLTEEEFYEMLANREFMPNTPTLMNAGTNLGLLSACYVIPVPDSLDGIFTALKHMAIVQQQGGGTGFSFNRLRPKGDIVRSTKGVASGPVTFATIFDQTTNVIKQGGKRRGANMGVLRVDHPDIVEFITAKAQQNVLTNFNLSVAVTDNFMEAVQKGKDFELINPRTGKAVQKVKARDIWSLIVNNAWKSGDPGIIFIDEINRKNPTAHIGEIEATNPCGEQPLHPYESCNLGSINLTKITHKLKNGKYEIDWPKLKKIVHKSAHFLDNVIDASRFPIPEIEQMTRANRRIGLGIMGWADLLLMLNIRYDSDAALKLAEKLMKFINDEAHIASQKTGRERGSFPNFKGSLWDKQKIKTMRNATCTTIAPTGTISIITNCSSGIEPLFAVSFVRNVLEGTRLLETNKIFEEVAKARGFYSEELMNKIAKTGSIKNFKEIPKDVRDVFVTALDIKPEWHVKMQAAFQKYTDNAVSKTINFPPTATVDEIKKAYELAFKLKCKGITVYRYGSKAEQVLYIGELEQKEKPEAEPYVVAHAETSGWCSSTLCPTP